MRRIIGSLYLSDDQRGGQILEENPKAQRPSDLDVVWLNGYGWPPTKVARCSLATWSARRPYWTWMKAGCNDAEIPPAQLLRDLAENGGKLTGNRHRRAEGMSYQIIHIRKEGSHSLL